MVCQSVARVDIAVIIPSGGQRNFLGADWAPAFSGDGIPHRLPPRRAGTGEAEKAANGTINREHVQLGRQSLTIHATVSPVGEGGMMLLERLLALAWVRFVTTWWLVNRCLERYRTREPH